MNAEIRYGGVEAGGREGWGFGIAMDECHRGKPRPALPQHRFGKIQAGRPRATRQSLLPGKSGTAAQVEHVHVSAYARRIEQTWNELASRGREGGFIGGCRAIETGAFEVAHRLWVEGHGQ